MKNKKTIAAIGMICLTLTATAQQTTVTIHADQGKKKIHKEIYGQFAEHLGTCIYGGIWVGTDSPIPNTNGYRNDVLQALKNLHIPVLRWPGGCFADEYHWMDGIGPRDQRPSMQNNNWEQHQDQRCIGIDVRADAVVARVLGHIVGVKRYEQVVQEPADDARKAVDGRVLGQ